MSSEQQERMAVQYAEPSLLFTVRSLLKMLEPKSFIPLSTRCNLQNP
ncbi:Tn5253 hypothetical protein [Streptococcus pneumoniae]|nr:Tn5253 hypothetical protein [Streptococcus pneumoniae]CEY61878.1 Tn5253 hypothetical protein [Streptococcus pneumoniae]CIQ24185.1 Tn5253 hypothetical protein [Streptococcus pneumoniae]CIR57032.1 Tn5253 hypothetical protein [Streptococcus pneumoniae]CIR87068.1 Tn5253 hypothetical protein [Streptococcus pneumoniae]